MNSSECRLIEILQREGHANHSPITDKLFYIKSQEMIIYHLYLEMKLFLIPTSVCFVAAFFVTPSILFAIFSNVSLRRETRFLLLANALFSDFLYLLLFTTTSMFIVVNHKVPSYVCPVLLFLLAVNYCGGVQTALVMVADTYLAVLWPLHYVRLLPSSRIKKLIALLWFSSCLFPAILFLTLYFTQEPGPCPLELCSLPVILTITLHGNDAIRLFHIFFISAFLLCFSLVLCCYFFLCYKTRETGIWKSILSRATATFLMHHAIFFSHFCPLLLLLIGSLLYINQVIDLETVLCLNLIICNVLIVLPKGVSPYLYGFRYRELYRSLSLFCKLKHNSLVAPENRVN
ncbi:probable G-protein coupled receptor 148 [Bombina bombina]|uniref:probable G-protein coupled receptor 148 n=1 Tax=Bombina bombina TaxID=8345 RepID=UPI00235B17F9|nr:probable G-protein coupled receptor 148 [Bombina bombina]